MGSYYDRPCYMLENSQIDTKHVDAIANVVEQIWLTGYPWPEYVTYDCGTEFMTEFTTTITKDYNLKKKTITICNPQTNSIVQCVYETIGNMLCTFELQ